MGLEKPALTIMIASSGKGKPFSFRISLGHFKAAICVVVLSAIVMLAVLMDYISLFPERVKNRQLHEERSEILGDLQIVSEKVNTLQTNLNQAKKFSDKLKLITSVNQPERRISFSMNATPVASRSSEEEMESEDVKRSPTSFKWDEPFFKAETIDEITGESVLSEREHDYSKLSVRIDALSKLSVEREQQVLDLWEKLQDRSALLAATPSTRPVQGRFTSRFGYRLSPYTDQPLMHEGLDIAAPPGSPVFAPAEGIVTFSGYNAGYGKLVVIDHGYGIETRYGHNSQLHVRVGQNVRHGDLLSAVGSTGHSTGPHVHYEVRVNGVPVDPMNYILDE